MFMSHASPSTPAYRRDSDLFFYKYYVNNHCPPNGTAFSKLQADVFACIHYLLLRFEAMWNDETTEGKTQAEPVQYVLA